MYVAEILRSPAVQAYRLYASSLLLVYDGALPTSVPSPALPAPIAPPTIQWGRTHSLDANVASAAASNATNASNAACPSSSSPSPLPPSMSMPMHASYSSPDLPARLLAAANTMRTVPLPRRQLGTQVGAASVTTGSPALRKRKASLDDPSRLLIRPPRVQLRLIDFAHIQPGKEGEGGMGLEIGIENLRMMMEAILQESKQQQPQLQQVASNEMQ